MSQIVEGKQRAAGNLKRDIDIHALNIPMESLNERMITMGQRELLCEWAKLGPFEREQVGGGSASLQYEGGFSDIWSLHWTDASGLSQFAFYQDAQALDFIEAWAIRELLWLGWCIEWDPSKAGEPYYGVSKGFDGTTKYIATSATSVSEALLFTMKEIRKCEKNKEAARRMSEKLSKGGFALTEEEKQLLQDLFDWQRHSEEKNWIWECR